MILVVFLLLNDTMTLRSPLARMAQGKDVLEIPCFSGGVCEEADNDPR